MVPQSSFSCTGSTGAQPALQGPAGSTRASRLYKGQAALQGTDGSTRDRRLYKGQAHRAPVVPLRIFLDVDEEIAISRAVERNLTYPRFANPAEVRKDYAERLRPLMALYRQELDPASRADILIDHRDLQRPQVVRGLPIQ